MTDQNTRELVPPGDRLSEVRQSLIDAAAAVAAAVCGDDAATEGLAAMLAAGAVLEVRVALPRGRIALQLVRGDKRETLATIGDVTLHAVN